MNNSRGEKNKKTSKGRSGINLHTRFIILFVIIIAISLTVYISWSSYSQRGQSKKEMREKAYVLSKQLDSVWEFIAINQDRINYDANGEYNFKGLHCSLAGKSIGKIFGKKTDYIIRYVNHNPRNPDDTPDSFESAALTSFAADSSLDEYYDISDYGGERVFRYVAPMKIDETCLECHGSPAGELDVLGYPKEGWEIGDLGGVLSIIMPLDIYTESLKSNITREVAFFCLLMVILVMIIYYATAKLVTKPLHKLTIATNSLKTGDFSAGIDVDEIDAQGEIRNLALHFADVISELREVYTGLENKVQLRTQDLARANDILEAQQAELETVNAILREDNEYKSEFLAIMSHELRTPLTSIVAFTEMLEKLKDMDSNPKEQQIIHEIKSNSQILLALINNTLDMAKLEAGKTEMYIDPVDFVDIVNAVESVIEPLAGRKHLSFHTFVARNVPIIEGDREKLRRIVENLLSNAVKFTPENGEINLSVEYDEPNDMILIKVKDSGIGIGKGHLNLIFDKFVQSDSSIHRPYNGSGLGLALARELAELHGGKITVESELNKGSLFTVHIPANSRNT